MKNGDIMYAPSFRSKRRMYKVEFLGRSAKGNLRIRWLEGKLKGKEALLESNSLRKNNELAKA